MEQGPALPRLGIRRREGPGTGGGPELGAPGHHLDRRLADRQLSGGSDTRLVLPGGWIGRRYHLGTNKEVFGAEAFAICRAPRTFDQRQESSHRYTIFADSTAAINRARSGAIGPGAGQGCDRGLLAHREQGQRGRYLLGTRPLRGRR